MSDKLERDTQDDTKASVGETVSEGLDTLSSSVSTDTRPRWEKFYRSTLFQIIIVGLCSFSAPGLWVALNSMGVAGSADPDLINGANAILYGCMTVTCFLGPWITNLIGFKLTLAFGSIGYPLYAAGLYVNNRFGSQWFVYFGAVACGISAGFFWSIEGAVACGYPEEHKRGRYIATWFTFRNVGNMVGGVINLALNYKANRAGAVGYQTYLAFIGLQCLGLFFGLLLSNPEKVVRDDGTHIEAPRVDWRTEAHEMWRLATSRPILLLAPLFWYYGWIQAYPGTFLATYFTVRSRALASLLSAIVGSISTWLAGSLVDLPWSNRRTRALVTFGVLVALNSSTWIWSVVIQNEYRITRPRLDWSHSGFGRGFGVYMFERISTTFVENYIYWCISNLSDSPGDQIRYSSLLRGIETAAVALSFGVQAIPTPLIVTAALNFGQWFAVLPISLWATLHVIKVFSRKKEVI
ncbi:uncharacterized protein CcaverHIS019_0203220 [Cutaneotrichosporon cavernicola]|uniref:DUF895 domain membrane protein n=1 Tax=Cutaneotrichosporon cavernicola TaxID=279322 RepID=A0AA48I6V7_9TREE|nr:uncharacterized protein CcaverHIS019_0203220 [Cutaneotrichosporon cavernicola]BEI88960.1 hypothetical protein CcaverHIS019_0203220 [Cutaneotrichosporon cavernicola]BEI96737.1 hypothetical protein CcaverHIS631_0203260 [Cutaneotrichosporon cavernicola]BEJ04509.1 hypothetical protein CcaverHIS641_0203260 [Cutaneotrichosporon cavernicola]